MSVDVLSLNNRLQVEGRELIDQLGLEGLLSKYGQVFISGSFAYGLMVDEDIDITVWWPGAMNDSIEIRKAIAEDLLSIPTIDSLNMSDREIFPSKYNRAGVWFCPSVWFKDVLWNIDIWFVPEGTTDVSPNTELHRRMLEISKEQKKIILEIKHQSHKAGLKHRGGVTSTNIYKAVLDGGVKTFEEFIALDK